MLADLPFPRSDQIAHAILISRADISTFKSMRKAWVGSLISKQKDPFLPVRLLLGNNSRYILSHLYFRLPTGEQTFCDSDAYRPLKAFCFQEQLG